MTVQYLIDSENVGDFWISLLELPADQTELIVFYTRNSPHMSYESLIKLKESDRTVTFIKCYEGTNALDFQLVTELGYRISKNESDRFVIVTNDTGFDAAVKYWRRSKKSVKRITGKECKNLERRRREDLEWRNASDRTRDHVNRAVIGEETETAAASSAVSSADPAEMQDVRPSRPVLRDAETAAEPEAEEADFVEEDFDSIPENEDEDYDPDFEEEEDDTDEAASDEVSSDEMSADNESIYDDSDEETGSEDEYDTHDYSDAEYSDQEPLSQDEADPEQVPEYNDADQGSQDSESSLIGSAQDIQKPDTSYAGAGMDSAFASSVSETEDGEESPGLRNDLNEDLRERFGEDFGEEFREEFKDGPTEEELSAPTPSGSHEKGKTADTAPGQDQDSSDTDDSIPAAGDNSHASEAASTGDLVSSGSVSGTGTDKKKKAGRTKPDESEENPESADSGQETDDQAADSPRKTRSRRSRSRRTKSGSKKAEPVENSSENSSSEEQKSAKTAAKSPDAETSSTENSAAAAEGDNSEASRIPGDEEIARIVACIGPDNLAELHNQLATFYGDQGKDIYLSIKNNTRSIPVLKPDLKQKFEYYCEIIFARSDYTGEYPADISEYLLSVREKLNNLTSLRYALLKHYGKEKGRRFYFLLKPFAKTMYQM